MYDINESIADQAVEDADVPVHMLALERWSPRVANQIAAEEGLELDDFHWEVIYALREHFRMLGPDWTARQVSRELERAFAQDGGRRFLYELFPHGPLAQACRLAGLPLPLGTLDRSFGSVH